MRITWFMPLLLAAVGAAQQAPPKPAIVEGTVVNSVTREPVRKTDLTLVTSLLNDEAEKVMAQFMGGLDEPSAPGASKPPKKSFSATTDAMGKFHFEVEAGDYYLKATRATFGDVIYKPEGKFALEGKVHLQPGDELKDVVIRMVPQGAISGRVIDEDGDPVGNAMVSAEKYAYDSGHRLLIPADTAQANDRGEFRLGKLPPGRYYVMASTGINPSAMMQAPPPAPKDGSPEMGYVRTYYPKATDVAAAGTIDVAAGADLPGFVITLQKSHVVRVKGKALDADGTPLKTGMIMLMAGVDPGSMRMQMLADPQGRFEIANVAPGTYMITTMQMSGASPTMHMQTLVVPEDGVKDVLLGGQTDGTVQGRVGVDGDGKVALQTVRIMMGGGSSAPSMPVFAAVSEAGEFALKKVAPAPYEISVQSVPAGAYVKSVRWDNKEKLGQTLDFSSGFGGKLEITLATDGGQFEAVVTRDGKPAGEATVVLIPSDPALRCEVTTHESDSDSAGNVTFRDVAPGRYLAFAWEDVEQGAWLDPVFLKPLESLGAAVTIEPKAHEKVELKLIPAK